MVAQGLFAHRFLRTVLRMRHAPPPEAVETARRRSLELLSRDLDNVEAGYYPRSLLTQYPYRTYLRRAPKLLRDIPRAVLRQRRRDFHDLPGDVDLRRYPPYYRRNFHWQTDGYFSRRSAELYDIGVEFLFLGLADVMRRQVIPPISRFRAGRDGKELRLLDVGCGTGRGLYQIALAHPDLSFYGLDLSPYYLSVAREVLSEVTHLSLVAENAEQMPFREGCFDVVTSIHLFHELPRNARRNVVREMRRVLRPGGLLVIEDSAQLSDSAELASVLDRFSNEFHEPFYRDYMGDELEELVTEHGFTVVESEPHFVSKVVVAELR
jgi:ubiquinone/menaquinone biosynthesis C-methylase UbiE